MSRWIDLACKVTEAFIAFCLAVMVVLVFGNVLLRYGFNSGIMVSEEVSRWLFIWITFLGAIVALKERAHLGVDMLVSRLPPSGKKVCLALSHLLMLYILWLLCEGSIAQIKINWDVSAPVTGASMAIVYFASLTFGVGAAALIVSHLLKLLTGRLEDEQLVAVQESEEAAALAEVMAAARSSAAEPARRNPQ
ncbi:MAG: TRAP transporter small permease [Hyphomicrobiales bacterium]|nr:MAG: TRAP transporter small permease [Hyphomicrobiales bacterium]